MARQDLIKYVRTDKNGTKIFYDFTCPRCSGYGMLDKWINTGKVCYACGGSGERAKAKIVKEYTEEYIAKLDARRIARQRKYEEEHAEEIEKEKTERKNREEQWKREQNGYTFKTLGCGADGIGYVMTGNTYKLKEQIKANGGRWISQAWVCPVQIKAEGIRTVRIDANTYINGFGLVQESNVRDLVYCIGVRGENLETAIKTVAEWMKD